MNIRNASRVALLATLGIGVLVAVGIGVLVTVAVGMSVAVSVGTAVDVGSGVAAAGTAVAGCGGGGSAPALRTAVTGVLTGLAGGAGRVPSDL